MEIQTQNRAISRMRVIDIPGMLDDTTYAGILNSMEMLEGDLLMTLFLHGLPRHS
jgi:hypothetical protein